MEATNVTGLNDEPVIGSKYAAEKKSRNRRRRNNKNQKSKNEDKDSQRPQQAQNNTSYRYIPVPPELADIIYRYREAGYSISSSSDGWD